MEVFTIGYEGAALEDFLSTLKFSGVELVVDVRELPISRRKGFAKKALSAGLSGAGIEYEHIKSLGDPKVGREAARAGNYEEFRQIFSAHLQTEGAAAGLDQLARLMSEKKACLLCYERDPSACHRTLILNKIKDTMKITVKHLGVRSDLDRIAAE